MCHYCEQRRDLMRRAASEPTEPEPAPLPRWFVAFVVLAYVAVIAYAVHRDGFAWPFSEASGLWRYEIPAGVVRENLARVRPW